MKNIFQFPYNDQTIIFIPFKKTLLLAEKSLWDNLKDTISGKAMLENDIGLTSDDLEFLRRDTPFGNQGRSFTRLDVTPTSATVFLTGKCTLRCRYCYAHGGDNPTSMDWDLYKLIVDKLIENSIMKNSKSVTLHYHGGGDISADWSLFRKMFDYFREQAGRRDLSINTSVGINGMLKPEQARWLTRNLNNITISLDGIRSVQDMQRPRIDGKGSFEQVVNTIRVFDEEGFGKYGIRMTVTDKSVESLPDSIEQFCEMFRVSHIKAEPMFNVGRPSDLNPPDQLAFINNFISARRIAVRYGRNLTYSGANLNSLCLKFCGATGSSYCFTPLGKISSCYEIMGDSESIGEMFVFGEVDRENRDFLINRKRFSRLSQLNVDLYDECRDCFCKWQCAGDCPVKRAYSILEGSGSHYRCKINKALQFYQMLEALEVESDEKYLTEMIKTF